MCSRDVLLGVVAHRDVIGLGPSHSSSANRRLHFNSMDQSISHVRISTHTYKTGTTASASFCA